ncbi:hypothetical protein Nepgr_023925 [Nepenthes gracilis]|uniref:Uncharacterized protein n=1 Tax=Nepenthes gracilis TaxID=150966 RepID=A0AAD3T4W2_NEPGR|nr:hypothetical protein Nepgr_023925 [Nepenthes gracilis]
MLVLWQHHDSLFVGCCRAVAGFSLKPSRLQILVAAIRITTLWFQHDLDELIAVWGSAASFTVLVALYVEKPEWSVHGLIPASRALEWACEGRAGLALDGFAGCLRTVIALKLVALPLPIDADLMETS